MDESGEDLFDEESGPEPDQSVQNAAHQGVPAAVRKLYDSFTGAPQPTTQSRMRSLVPGSDARGGHYSFTTGADHAPRSTGIPGMAKLAARAQKRNGRATCAPGVGGSFPSQMEDGAWHQNHLQTRKIGKDERIEKYKCRFVAQRFR